MSGIDLTEKVTPEKSATDEEKVIPKEPKPKEFPLKVLVKSDEMLCLWELLGNARVTRGHKAHASLMDKLELSIQDPGGPMRSPVFKEDQELELTMGEKEILHTHCVDPTVLGWRTRPWSRLRAKLEGLSIL